MAEANPVPVPENSHQLHSDDEVWEDTMDIGNRPGTSGPYKDHPKHRVEYKLKGKEEKVRTDSINSMLRILRSLESRMAKLEAVSKEIVDEMKKIRSSNPTFLTAGTSGSLMVSHSSNAPRVIMPPL